MRRWTSLVLAGALGWPAVSFAQDSLPATSGPAATDPGKATVQRTAMERPTAEGFLPVVPPLPPAPTMAQAAPPGEGKGELPKPTPVEKPGQQPAAGSGQAGPVPGIPSLPSNATAMHGHHQPVVPDVHGMPMPDKHAMHGGFPPSTCAPMIPAPCPPPPPVPECAPDACGPIFFGDFLFLRASRRDPSIEVQFNTGLVSANDLVGYDGDHEYAYRVGGGWLTEGSWIFLASYMQFKDLVSNQIFANPDPNGNFTLTYVGPGQLLNTTLGQPGTMITSWNLQFRAIDVFFGGCWSPTNYLDVVAGGGLKLLYIDQDYRTTIDASVSGGAVQGENLVMNTTSMGPRMGGEARCYIYPWFNLYGRGFGSLLLAHRNDDSILLESDAGGVINSLSYVTYSREEVLPVLELAVGAEVTVFNGRLQLGGGYEFTYIWQASTSSVDALSTPRVITHNDLSLDGFYARINWLW